MLAIDLELDDVAEIVCINVIRWSHEVFFKNAKSLYKLRAQHRSFTMFITHTLVVFAKCILFECDARQNKDYCSNGELFFMLCDDI